MRVLVAGAGAVGAYFGGLLARAGHDVTLLARGNNGAAIQRHGIRIEGGPDAGTAAAKVLADLAGTEAPDLVILTVKTYDTASACDAIKGHLHEQTPVLVLQNGVDRANEVEQSLGPGHALAGAVFMESRLVRPGVVKYLSGPRRIIFGEPGGGPSLRAVELERALRAAGIDAVAEDDVRTQLWWKFLLVCAANALTALTRSQFGTVIRFPHGRETVAGVMEEVAAVGRRLGRTFPAGHIESAIAFLEDYGPQLESSMLFDIERGRLTEADALNGYVVRQAQALGLDVPANRLIWLTLALHNQAVVERRGQQGG